MLWYLFGCLPHAPIVAEPAAVPPTMDMFRNDSVPGLPGEELTQVMSATTETLQATAINEEELGKLLQNPLGRPLVVNFWATWCSPCVEELPYLERLSEQYPAATWVLINVDGANLAAVQRWLAERPVGLPLRILDSKVPADVLARQVPAWEDAIPLTLVLHPGGGVHSAHQGALSPGQLEASLLSLGNPRICGQHGM